MSIVSEFEQGFNFVMTWTPGINIIWVLTHYLVALSIKGDSEGEYEAE